MSSLPNTNPSAGNSGLAVRLAKRRRDGYLKGDPERRHLWSV